MCIWQFVLRKKMTLEKNCAVWICADSFFSLCIMEVVEERLPLFCDFSLIFVYFVHKYLCILICVSFREWPIKIMYSCMEFGYNFVPVPWWRNLEKEREPERAETPIKTVSFFFKNSKGKTDGLLNSTWQQQQQTLLTTKYHDRQRPIPIWQSNNSTAITPMVTAAQPKTP